MKMLSFLDRATSCVIEKFSRLVEADPEAARLGVNDERAPDAAL